MSQESGADRRKLTNMLIDPGLQLMLFMPYVVILIGFVTTNLLVVRSVISSFSQISLDPGSEQIINLNNVYRNLLFVSSAGLIGAAGVGFILVIVVSHRVLGPLYNIQRHVRRLKDGEYEHRIVLRKGDRLVQLAADLNEVTGRLKASVGTPAPKS